MRPNAFALLAGAATLVYAQDPMDEEFQEPTEPTTFNQVKVPLLVELTPSNWNDEINKTRWMLVKHYSPYCPHCQDFGPTYQTLYEFYYTSKPAKDTTFLDYYDFRFGTVNCIAFSDLCVKHEVKSYPQTILYERDQVFGSVRGAKNMTVVSNLVESALEKTKPGSRPKKLVLPEPGATKSPEADGDGEAPSAGEAAKGKEEDAKTPAAKHSSGGISVLLTAESFQKDVTMSQEPWLIKFFAPWCKHCQAMAPTWNQLAKTMRGKLNIGEVDCVKEPRLCKDIGVGAYPTIMFFKGAERTEYTGLRGLGDFVQYAEKAVEMASGVPDVDVTSFKALEETENVIFVYFYDHATTSEDFRALERLPLSLIGHAKLVKTKDVKMNDRFKITTWPRLLVSREGRPTYYPPLTPNEMRDVNTVRDWMKSVWLPLVPELTPSNARQIMDGKIVVLSILNSKEEQTFASSLRESKSAANEWLDRQTQEFQLERKKLRDAKQMRIEEAEDRDDQRALRAAKALRINMDNAGHKEVAFAWVDGVYWQRWIRTTYGMDIKDGERIIINDEDNRRYWDTTVTGNHILVSRTSIMETLDKIVYGPHVIKHKLTVSVMEKVLLDMRVAFMEHPYLSLGCVAGIGFALFSWLRGRSRRRRGHFKLDDSMGIKDLKAGLLGTASGNQKAD